MPNKSKAILLLTALASLTIAAHATEWKTYHDDDFRECTITYFSFLHAVPWRVLHPDNWDSPARLHNLTFSSDDGEVQLHLATFNVPGATSLTKYFEEEISDREKNGETVTYSVVKDNWYVVSGVDEHDYECYKKFYLFPQTEMTGGGTSFANSLTRTTRTRFMIRWSP